MPLPEPIIPFHELLDELPMMDDAQFAAFVEDVKAAGKITEPIMMLDGAILGGRHRHLAEIVTGIKARTVEFNPAKHGDPWDWVISQMARRERDASMKAVEAVLLLERAPKGKRGDGELLDQISKRINVGSRYVEAARSCRNKHKGLWKQLASGKLKITQVINKQKHATAKDRVEKLKVDANLTIADCDLRHGDNVALMKAMPAASVRCIFADSPYNQGWRYRADTTGDALTRTEFLDVTRAWMTECARLLADDGTIYVLINDAWVDDFGLLLREVGLTRQPTIVWWETFSNYRSGETGPSCVVRYILRYTKTAKPFFNAYELREPSKREAIYNDKRQSGIGKVPDNVWPIARVTGTSDERVPWGNADDAPQLPIEVPERCVLMSSEPGDPILDPFNGNGITGIASLLNGRRYVGLDRDQQGLDQARTWIAHSLQRFAARDATAAGVAAVARQLGTVKPKQRSGK